MTAGTFKAPKKETITGIAAIIVYLITGILLLAKPEWMAEFTRWALFAGLLCYAVIAGRRYFKLSPEEAAKGYSLTGAMVAATLAVLALFNTEILTDHIWGVLLLAGGYMKFQTAMDMGRMGHKKLWLFLAPATVSLVFGVLIVVDVIRTNTTTFIGIALIVEALVDLAALIMTSDKLGKKKEKEGVKEEAAKDAEPAAPAAEAPAEGTPAGDQPAEAEAAKAEEKAETAE